MENVGKRSPVDAEEEIRKLRAENAHLRSLLNSMMANSVPSSDVRLAAVTKLTEYDNALDTWMTGSNREKLSQLENGISPKLEREIARRLRMEDVIRRQQSIIKSITQNSSVRVLDEMRSNESSNSSDEIPTSSKPKLPPVQALFLPPWDIDMDDIRRQLADLSQTVCRVEDSTDKLRDSTQCIKNQSSFEGVKFLPMDRAVPVDQSKNNSMLNRIYNTTSE